MWGNCCVLHLKPVLCWCPCRGFWFWRFTFCVDAFYLCGPGPSCVRVELSPSLTKRHLAGLLDFERCFTLSFECSMISIFFIKSITCNAHSRPDKTGHVCRVRVFFFCYIYYFNGLCQNYYVTKFLIGYPITIRFVNGTCRLVSDNRSCKKLSCPISRFGKQYSYWVFNTWPDNDLTH